MSLAGKLILHGTLGIIHHGRQPLNIGLLQVGPLIRREPPRRADRQCIERLRFARFEQPLLRLVAPLSLLPCALRHKIRQLGHPATVRLRQQAGIDV
jgi:hypothetical protein